MNNQLSQSRKVMEKKLKFRIKNKKVKLKLEIKTKELKRTICTYSKEASTKNVPAEITKFFHLVQ